MLGKSQYYAQPQFPAYVKWVPSSHLQIWIIIIFLKIHILYKKIISQEFLTNTAIALSLLLHVTSQTV